MKVVDASDFFASITYDRRHAADLRIYGPSEPTRTRSPAIIYDGYVMPTVETRAALRASKRWRGLSNHVMAHALDVDAHHVQQCTGNGKRRRGPRKVLEKIGERLNVAVKWEVE